MSKKVEVTPFDRPIALYDNMIVKAKYCGNIVESMFITRINQECKIKKISKEEYINLETGEIKAFVHKDNRQQDLNSVRSSLRRLRDKINTNVTDARYCKWVTLTYAENMTDTDRLYEDFKNFIKRLRYYYKEMYKIEYIVAMEPQARGAWHAHLILIFDAIAPFIPNETIAELWGHGYTKTKKLDNVDNIGAYLTAYLGDMELNEENLRDIQEHGANAQELKYKDVEATEDGKTVSKAIIKGGRLYLYPVGFHLYRMSKGIKPPTVEIKSEGELQEEVKELELTYKKAIKVTFYNKETEDAKATSETIIYYRYYNRLKKRRE